LSLIKRYINIGRDLNSVLINEVYLLKRDLLKSFYCNNNNASFCLQVLNVIEMHCSYFYFNTKAAVFITATILEFKLTEGLIYRQVRLNNEHWGSCNLHFFKDMATTSVQHTIDASNSNLRALLAQRKGLLFLLEILTTQQNIPVLHTGTQAPSDVVLRSTSKRTGSDVLWE
jgi:hypothetical protein